MTPEPIKLYSHDGVLTYDTPGGTMTVPPHVRTPTDCAIYFNGIPFTFVTDPTDKLMTEGQQLAVRKRAREAWALSNRARRQERERQKAEAKAAGKAKPATIDRRYSSGNWKGRVAQYTLEGKLVGVHRSAREAARNIGAGLTCVVYACRDAGRSCHGYQWRWYLGERPPRRIKPYIDGRSSKGRAAKSKKEEA